MNLIRRKTRIPTIIEIWTKRIKKVLGDYKVKEWTYYGVILTKTINPSKTISIILNEKEEKATIVVNEEAYMYPRQNLDDFEEKLWEHHPERTLN
ncbi:MAG: hypothetical protein F6K08_16595 [Okeania sp. SIO1H6]|nr:hypothetical protein [Okeania sp. SIO1H6]